MPFILHCLDKPGHAHVRRQTRAAHLAYVAGRQHVFMFGGPLVDDGGQPRGSLMILDLPDRAALDSHMRGDPFFSADLFESVTVWTTRQVMPEREPGALALELQAALAGPPHPIPTLRVTGEHAP